MGIAERLRAPAPPTGRVDQVLAELDDDDRDALLEALVSDMPTRRLAGILAAEGIRCSDSAITFWRRTRAANGAR